MFKVGDIVEALTDKEANMTGIITLIIEPTLKGASSRIEIFWFHNNNYNRYFDRVFYEGTIRVIS